MHKALYLFAALLAAGIGYFAYQLWPQPEPEALIYQPPRALKAFQLESTDSQQPIANAALEGQWTLLFTGYTYCPDICPTTMSDLRRALPELQDHTDVPVKVWLISVDPKRDSLQRLNEYTGYFGSDFVGIRAEHPQLFPFVRDLGLMYSVPEEDEENYLVNHSAAIILVNPQGNRTAIFNADPVPGEIPVVDMQQLQQDFALIVD